VVDRADFVAMVVGFGRELRAAGISLGTGELMSCAAAAALLDPTDLVDLYWSGRTTLVASKDQIPVYDRVFRSYFLEDGDGRRPAPAFPPNARAEASAMLQLPETRPDADSPPEEPARLGLVASDAATLRTKAFELCTADELVALRRIVRTIRLTPPRRRTRRTAPAGHGRQPDLRRTLRDTLRRHGDPAELRWRDRTRRPRPLVLLLDVSGSMAEYSRTLVQFAHSTSRAGRRVEVFCFGTRLTRITRELDHRRPDVALARAAAAVLDWDGGTRIGASLESFVTRWGRRGLCRGGVVVICSDGLDRGDPAQLDAAMRRLSRQCHRVVWLNPHLGGEVSTPTSLGMLVAAPHIDLLASGHDLRSLEEFAARLPELR